MSQMLSNPYQSPIDTQEGYYDHWLRNRILKCVAALLLFFAILDGILLCCGNLYSNWSDSPIDVIKTQIEHELMRVQ